MNTISLFSGAGGLDIGANNAGAIIRCCIENDHDSVQTLLVNNKAKDSFNVIEDDIRNVSGQDILSKTNLKIGEIDLVIGGPPCQSFSKNNYWTHEGQEALRRRKRDSLKTPEGNKKNFLASLEISKKRSRIDVSEDHRTLLIYEFARLVKELSPSGFVLENVSSLLHPKNKVYLDEFIRRVESYGYAINYFVLSSEEFGVAQKRKRIFVLGKKGHVLPSKPNPTHSSDPSTGLLKVVPVKLVIDKFKYDKYFEPEELIEGRWKPYLPDIPPGMNYKALTRWAAYKNPIFEAETRFWNFLLKLDPNKPSWTIPASPGPWIGPLHWNNRRLRTVELAAIQDFPLGYKFHGNRKSIVKQIGNAVPSKMAEAVIRSLIRDINQEKHNKQTRKEIPAILTEAIG